MDDAEKEARDICQGVHHGEDAGAFCLCDQIAHALREAKAEQKIIEDDLRDRLRQATEGLARIAKGEALFDQDPAGEARMTLMVLCRPGEKYKALRAGAKGKGG